MFTKISDTIVNINEILYIDFNTDHIWVHFKTQERPSRINSTKEDFENLLKQLNKISAE
jgi:hypothetical protein